MVWLDVYQITLLKNWVIKDERAAVAIWQSFLRLDKIFRICRSCLVEGRADVTPSFSMKNYIKRHYSVITLAQNNQNLTPIPHSSHWFDFDNPLANL